MQDETKKFFIGDYAFETLHEFRNGQDDVKKIEVINEELDIQDPEVAVRLYNKIRTGEIVFKSIIGEKFSEHVADIVAERSVGLLEDKAVMDEAEGRGRQDKVLGTVIVALAVVAFVYFGYREFQEYMTTRRLAQLQAEVGSPVSVYGSGSRPVVPDAATAENAVRPKAEEPAAARPAQSNPGDALLPVHSKWEKKKVGSDAALLVDYENLYAENEDLCGWLSIDGTTINYPVMQKDNEFYLKHAFDGSEDVNGAIFADDRCDPKNPTTNTILYGHNMKSGLMFGSLKNYLEEGYYNGHKNLSFNSLYEKRRYELIAVCLARVEYQDEDDFRYYNFITAENKQQFNEFYANISALSIFDQEIEADETDEFLTLSTCNSYIEDGRLFLVAKRVE